MLAAGSRLGAGATIPSVSVPPRFSSTGAVVSGVESVVGVDSGLVDGVAVVLGELPASFGSFFALQATPPAAIAASAMTLTVRFHRFMSFPLRMAFVPRTRG